MHKIPKEVHAFLVPVMGIRVHHPPPSQLHTLLDTAVLESEKDLMKPLDNGNMAVVLPNLTEKEHRLHKEN